MNTDDLSSFQPRADPPSEDSCSLPPEAVDTAAVPALTLADHAEGLCKRYESWQSSPHTIIRLRRALQIFNAYMEDHHNVSTADAVTLEHVHAFQSHMSQRFTEKGLPWKPISINTVIKAVRPFLDYLHELGYITRDLSRHLQYSNSLADSGARQGHEESR